MEFTAEETKIIVRALIEFQSKVKDAEKFNKVNSLVAKISSKLYRYGKK